MISDNMEKWAWDMACQVYPCNPLDEFGLALRADIAYALIKARSEAFEESAKIAETCTYKTFMAWDYDGVEPVEANIPHREEVAQAIRQHSQKGRDK